MINVIFWSACLLYTFICILNIIKKNYFSVSTFILLGITIPLILYFLGWSDYIFEKPSENFYIIFVYFYIIAILFSVTTMKYKYKQKKFEIKNEKLINYITIGYCILYLTESYLGSGTFFPSFNKIDIHTFSYPVLSLITRSLYPFLLFNFIIFLKTYKKRYLFNILFLLFITIVTRSSRIIAFISLMQVCCFVGFYLMIYKNNIKINISKRVKKIGIISIIIIIIGMVSLTNYRMNNYGKYDLKYTEEIKYTGPKIFENIISVYYGYFPMSFNNLNYNINHLYMKHNYIGLYTFIDLYFGIFQLDNIIGTKAYYPNSIAYIITPAATVRTAFFEYYYDFGELTFIPIFIMFLYQSIIKIKMKKTNKMIWDFLYFFYVPLFFFLSFQNLFFASSNLWAVFITYIFYKLFIKCQDD